MLKSNETAELLCSLEANSKTEKAVLFLINQAIAIDHGENEAKLSLAQDFHRAKTENPDFIPNLTQFITRLIALENLNSKALRQRIKALNFIVFELMLFIADEKLSEVENIIRDTVSRDVEILYSNSAENDPVISALYESSKKLNLSNQSVEHRMPDIDVIFTSLMALNIPEMNQSHAESNAFLQNHNNFFKDAKQLNDLIERLKSELEKKDVGNLQGILELNKYKANIRLIHFLLFQAIPEGPEYFNSRGELLRLLNSQACKAFDVAFDLMKCNQIPHGLNKKVIADLKIIEDVINNTSEEVEDLLNYAFEPKASAKITSTLIKSLKDEYLDFYQRKIYQSVMLSEISVITGNGDLANKYIEKAKKDYQLLEKNIKSSNKAKFLKRKKPDGILKELKKLIVSYEKTLITDLAFQKHAFKDFKTLMTSRGPEYLSALNAVKENLKDKPDNDQKSPYKYELLEKNITILSSRTKSLSANVVTMKAHVEMIFKNIIHIKNCRDLTEAKQLLLLTRELCQELSIKIQSLSGPIPLFIKTVAESMDEMAVETAIISEMIINQSLGKMAPVEDNNQKLNEIRELPTGIVKHEICQLLGIDSASSEADIKIESILNNLTKVKELVDASFEQIALSFEKLSEFQRKAINREQSKELIAFSLQNNDLALYVINKVLHNQPVLELERIHGLRILFKKVALTFTIGEYYFRTDQNYSSQDEALFFDFQKLYNELELQLPILNEFIKDTRNASLIVSEYQHAYKVQLYALHHDILKYKAYFAAICNFFNQFEKAEEVVEGLQKAVDNTHLSNETENSFERVESYAKLIMDVTPLQNNALKIIQEYKCALNNLKTGEHYVYYAIGNDLCAFDLVASIKNIYTESRNFTYERNKLIDIHKLFGGELNNPTLRIALTNKILSDYALPSEDDANESSEVIQNRINLLQENINFIYFSMLTIAQLHVEKYPESDVINRFQVLLFSYVFKLTNDIDLLAKRSAIPYGSYLTLYQNLNANFHLYLEHLKPTFEGGGSNTKEERQTLQLQNYKKVFLMYVCFADLFYQFADVNLKNVAHNHAGKILDILQRDCLLTSELNRLVEALDQSKVQTSENISAFKQFELLAPLGHDVLYLFNQFSTTNFLLETQEPSAQQFLQDLKNKLSIQENDVVADIRIILQLNDQFGINDTKDMLIKINKKILKAKKQHAAKRSPIDGMIAETLDAIIASVENCIKNLDKKSKQMLKSTRSFNRRHGVYSTTFSEQTTSNSKVDTQGSEANDALNLEFHHEKMNASHLKSFRESTKKKLSSETLEDNLTYDQILKQDQEEQDKKSMKATSKERRMLKREREREFVKNQELEHNRMLQQKERQKASKTNLEKKGNKHTLSPIRQDDKNETMLDFKNMTLDKISNHLFNNILGDLVFEIAELILKEETHVLSYCKVKNVKIEIDVNAKYLLEQLNRNGISAYVYGGYVRDKLLSRQYRDIDIVALCDRGVVQKALGSRCIDNVNSPIQLVFDNSIDIACVQDVRDFVQNLDITINSFLADKNGYVYDPLRAISDLNCNELIMIKDPMKTFASDPRCLFRIIRQGNDLGKKINTDILKALVLNRHRFTQLPFTVYLYQVSSLFLRGSAQKNLQFIIKNNLLGDIFPQLNRINYKHPLVVDWLSNNCMQIDFLDEGQKVNRYSFSKQVSIFLAPLIYERVMRDYSSPSERVFYETIEEFFNQFSDYKPRDHVVSHMFDDLRQAYDELSVHHIQFQRLEQKLVTPIFDNKNRVQSVLSPNHFATKSKYRPN